MVKLGIASSTQDLQQIIDLQRRYHANSLSPNVQAREGFVFAAHTLAQLQRMARELPQVIAVADAAVVGYCLAMPLSLRDEIPGLTPMFDQFDDCVYRGQPLASFRFFVGGQVCVDRAYRGRGLLAQLYEHARVSVPKGFDLCVTEIAARNGVSIRAHQRMGFETIATYADTHENWVVVAWNIARPALLAQPIPGASRRPR